MKSLSRADCLWLKATFREFHNLRRGAPELMQQGSSRTPPNYFAGPAKMGALRYRCRRRPATQPSEEIRGCLSMANVRLRSDQTQSSKAAPDYWRTRASIRMVVL